MIPIHAIATADPQQLRWVISADRLPPAGRVRRAPGRLGIFQENRVIDEMVIRATAGQGELLITLSAGHSWRELGDDVRVALDDALSDPGGWRIDPIDSAAQLAAIAAELLAGSIGALAESHGGSIELVSVTGDTVTVRMSGACHGCSAQGSTLHDKLQRELRRRAGRHVLVSSESDSPALPLGRRLLSLIVR
jgi:NFU1 iron-sulfur cluster scaffold homolog, mitochondrial